MKNRSSILFVLICSFSIQSLFVLSGDTFRINVDPEILKLKAEEFLKTVDELSEKGNCADLYRQFGHNNYGKKLVKEIHVVSLLILFACVDKEVSIEKIARLSDVDCDSLIRAFVTGTPRRTQAMESFESLANLLAPIQVAIKRSNEEIEAAEMKLAREKGSCFQLMLRKLGCGRFAKSNLQNE